MRILIKRSG